MVCSSSLQISLSKHSVPCLFLPLPFVCLKFTEMAQTFSEVLNPQLIQDSHWGQPVPSPPLSSKLLFFPVSCLSWFLPLVVVLSAFEALALL